MELFVCQDDLNFSSLQRHQLLTHQKKDIYNKILHQTQHKEKHFLHLW